MAEEEEPSGASLRGGRTQRTGAHYSGAVEDVADEILDDPEKRSKVLGEVKAQRKSAEADVQLLANRLQHLRNEEAKARSKIAATQNRAAEIRYLKKRNEDHRRLRDQQKLIHHEAVKQESATMTRDRTGRKAHIKMARDRLVASNRKEFEKERQLKQKQSTMLADRRRDEMMRNKRRKEEIQAMQKARREKREAAEVSIRSMLESVCFPVCLLECNSLCEALQLRSPFLSSYCLYDTNWSRRSDCADNERRARHA